MPSARLTRLASGGAGCCPEQSLSKSRSREKQEEPPPPPRCPWPATQPRRSFPANPEGRDPFLLFSILCFH